MVLFGVECDLYCVSEYAIDVSMVIEVVVKAVHQIKYGRCYWI